MAGYIYQGTQRGLTAEEIAGDQAAALTRCPYCGYLNSSIGHQLECLHILPDSPRTAPLPTPPGDRAAG